MKKIITILIMALMLSITAFGQTKSSDNAKLKAQIIALDRSGWEAWKTKNVKWFQVNTTEDFVTISGDGVSDKAQVIKSTPTDCDVKSYSLDDFKFVVLNEKTVLLTYIATEDAVCGGKKIPEKVRATVTYVKRGDRWLEACYMDTPVTQ